MKTTGCLSILLPPALFLLWGPNSISAHPIADRYDAAAISAIQTAISATERAIPENATLTQAVTEKPGTCPTLIDGALLICGVECISDQGCDEAMKCCKNSCGYTHCQHPQDKIIEQSQFQQNES